jgi:hypothetical protein
LPFVALAEQWREMRARLPEDWGNARLTLTLDEAEQADRAALILGPLTPGRTGSAFRLTVERSRDPERALARLDEEGIGGRLELAGAEKKAAAPAPRRPAVAPRPLAEQWDELTERLPPDWSDLYVELELDSTDFLERAALLLAPVNPAHYGGPRTFRFRCASRQGYGVAEGMARRCLERLDAERITGRVRALRVLSSTAHVATQGPVWRSEGRAV